jgi:ribonuclease HI
MVTEEKKPDWYARVFGVYNEPPKPRCKVYTKGVCDFDKSLVKYAFIVREEGVKIHEEFGTIPFSELPSSRIDYNIAEFTAIKKSLEWMVKKDEQYKFAEFVSGNKYIVLQLAGHAQQPRGERYTPFIKGCEELLKQIEITRFRFKESKTRGFSKL